MTVPLWILAFFAAVAGVMAVSSGQFSLSNWMDPVFGANLYHDNLSHRRAVDPRPSLDAVIAVVGVFIGLRTCGRPGRTDPVLEAAFLRGAWYINELYDAVFGRPSERLAAFCADVVDTQDHRRRRQRRGRRLPGDRARCSGAPRPATSATTWSGSSSAPWWCSASC